MAIRWPTISDRAHVPVNATGLNALSVAFWLNWDAFADFDQAVISYGAAPNGFWSHPNSGLANRWSIMIQGSPSSNYNVSFFLRPAIAGTWAHVVISACFVGPTLQLWVNGVQSSVQSTGSNGSGAGAGPFSSEEFHPFVDGDGSSSGVGSMCELSMWGGGGTAALLTATEIQALYRGQSPLKIPSKQLLGYYPMNYGDRRNYARIPQRDIRIVTGTVPIPSDLPVNIDSPKLMITPFVSDAPIGLSSGVEVETAYIDIQPSGVEDTTKLDSATVYVNIDGSGVDGIQHTDAASFLIDIRVGSCEWYVPTLPSEFLFNAYTQWSQEASTQWTEMANGKWQWTVQPVAFITEEVCV